MCPSDFGVSACSKFGPGEEKAARLYLRRPPKHPRYWMIPNRGARLGLLWGSWSLPLLLFGVLQLRSNAELLYESCGVFFVLIVAVCVGVMLHEGLFVLDPAREILRYARKDYPFASLPLPRITKSTLVTTDGDIGYNSRIVLKYDTLSLGRLVLFNGQDVSLKRIHKIADLLNAMLAEYHEREEVHAWLEQRGMLDDPEEEVTRVS